VPPWREGFVQVLRTVSAEVIEHDANAFGVRVVAVDEVAHAMGEVDAGSLVGHLDVPPRAVRIDEDEEIRRSVTSVFVVDSGRSARALRHGQCASSKAPGTAPALRHFCGVPKRVPRRGSATGHGPKARTGHVTSPGKKEGGPNCA
jgi:hypothetical protein